MTAETGSIYDLGYRRYEGPRLGRAHAVRSLFAHSLRSSYGIGRGGRAKIAPIALLVLVAALAALNAFGGFCVGCAVYYWLARFNLPGFGKQPPNGTFPGMKPRAGANV